ncbi:GTP-binding protein [Alkalihalophilus marmarensis]|jgi:G3E family GTPase|uniref:GTPase, G3E family n=1 Tax=Alkalihalophilus marmarensis DSM 21297 TaxID=1188261 RepID=U6SRC5_9BACI|nr:CobW family GTP-binding protein [Alkalihalophilus marmarensis]ERN53897.1 hypothetical protein A33I_09505 [Alkalihalophilus marmarensis DSM 21297]MCM3490590.1 GTP-binding protein [Alkalihalophilus marmarensis]
MSRVPVFVLSGFLGSGKTTLLERLLTESVNQGLRATVLMNEIGKTDTDGNILEGKSEMIEKLLDGCICCNKKSEVAQSMEKLLNLDPDVIFIELTGVANPEEVADSLTEPQLINQVYLEKVITLIDSEHILSYNSIFESDRELVRTTRRQIEVADTLIVNKMDLVSEAKRQKIDKLLKKQNSTSSITYSTYSDVDVTSLFQPINTKTKKVRVRIKHSNHREHHHEHPPKSFTKIKSIRLPVPTATSSHRVEKFLKKWKTDLLRAKGYVELEDGTYLMQHVMKRVSWTKSTYHGDHYLVLIGLSLDESKIKEDWNAFFSEIRA